MEDIVTKHISFNPFGPNFGGQEPDTDTPPGGPPPGLDPLSPPEVPPVPSDAELEDIQDAENRQELFREFHRVIAPVVVMKKYDEDKS